MQLQVLKKSVKLFRETPYMLNNSLKINNKPIYNKELEKFSLYKVNQFRNNNDEYMSYYEFINLYPNINFNYLEYISLITCFKRMEKFIERNHVDQSEETSWSLIFKTDKGVKYIYQSLLKKDNIPYGIAKWKKHELDIENWTALFKSLYDTTKGL